MLKVTRFIGERSCLSTKKSAKSNVFHRILERSCLSTKKSAKSNVFHSCLSTKKSAKSNVFHRREKLFVD